MSSTFLHTLLTPIHPWPHAEPTSICAARVPSIVVPPHLPDSRADEIAMISHELRNSLGVVRNAADCCVSRSAQMASKARACSSNATSAR